MLNFHLNGDIVRCPDIAAIQKRVRERKDVARICKYGCKESECPFWQASLKCWQNVKNTADDGRCNLAGFPHCPGHISQVQKGRKEKTFQFTTESYRKISSAAHDLVKTSTLKVLFITLTFPKFKKKNIDEKQYNKCFSKFVENLRTNYGCTGYIAVREFGGDHGRVHFHLICSLPYTKFAVLNNAWCSAVSDICEYSKSAIRTTKQSLYVKDPARAIRYLSKYFQKSRGLVSKTKILFISNNLLTKPVCITGSIQNILTGYKGIYISQPSDYVTCFKITNPKELNRFFLEFLYPLYNSHFNYNIFGNQRVDFTVLGQDTT